jgi:hypothetical protein
MAESQPQEGLPGAPVSDEASLRQKSSASLMSTYRNTAARLLAMHADRAPLDVTSLADTPLGGRTRLEVTARPAGRTRAHIAETNEQYCRPTDLLGLAVLESVSITRVTLHEGIVGGDVNTMRQEYDEAGNLRPGETRRTERKLAPEELAVALAGITELAMDMTVDMPEATIEEIEQAMIAAEEQRQAPQMPPL